MVEGTTLERWHTRKGIEGSNPSLSVAGTVSLSVAYLKGIPLLTVTQGTDHADQTPTRSSLLRNHR